MKYTTKIERVVTHYVTVEIEADGLPFAEKIAEELMDKLDYPSNLVHESIREQVLQLVTECSSTWELEEESFEVMEVSEGGL